MPSDQLGAYLDKWTPQRERDHEWVSDLMRQFRYKPDWHFDVKRVPEVGTVGIHISVMVPDSRRGPDAMPRYGEITMTHDGMVKVERDDLIPIQGIYYLPPYLLERRDERRFWDWLRDAIGSVEMHERDEWFYVGKTLPYDPHRVGL